MHDLDEYTIYVSGEFVACLEDKEVILKPGDELYVPKGTIQWRRCKAGTITISALVGQELSQNLRIQKPDICLHEDRAGLCIFLKPCICLPFITFRQPSSFSPPGW